MIEFAPTGNPKLDIPALIRWQANGLTFIELLRFLPYLKGNRTFLVDGAQLVGWVGVSDDCVEAIRELATQGKIIARPGSQFTYLLDGGGLRLPIAKGNRKYRKPHWLPIIFDLPINPARKSSKAA